MHPSDKEKNRSRSKRVRAKLKQTRILVESFIAVMVLMLGLYLAISNERDVAVGILMLAITGAVTFGYAQFYYLEANETTLTQVKYFGLSHQTIRLKDLVSVTGGVTDGVLFHAPAIHFNWAGGTIEIDTTAYDPDSLVSLLSHLRRSAVPFDHEILERYGFE
jgi:hypothetical protein